MMKMSDRKRLLLIGATTGYQTGVFAEAAKRLGFQLALATDRCHVLDNPWGDHALPLRFEDSEGAARTIAAEAKVDGIVAVGDRPAYIAALAAQLMGIPTILPTRFSPAAVNFSHVSVSEELDCWCPNSIASR